MTIPEFLAAEHAVSGGGLLPADITESKDDTAMRAHPICKDWVLSMVDHALAPCYCEACKALPEGNAKVKAGIASALHEAFLFGVRCGRMVPE